MRPAAAFLVASLCPALPAAAADHRAPVDPNQPPWDAVAKVQTNTGVHCTGVLIAPSVVLTAAHCLYNRRTLALLQPVSLHVLFGYERAGYRWHRLVKRVETDSGFDGRHPAPGLDWARLELSEPVPPAPLSLEGGSPYPGLTVVLAGYNQDRAQLLMADQDCHVMKAQPLPNGATAIWHDCWGTHGTSGAPLLRQRASGWTVLGINILAGQGENLAITPPFGE